MLTINKNKNKKLSGFTLLELIVVIAIIAILAVIAIPSFNKALEKSRLSAIKSDIAILTKAIEVYAANNGGYYNNRTPVTSYTRIGSADQPPNGGIYGNCNSPLFENTAFADPEVKKLIATLNNKIYDGGPFLDKWYNYYGSKRIICNVSEQDVNRILFILYNIDQKNTGVCWDSAGFYNGYDYTKTDETNDYIDLSLWGWKCKGMQIAPAGVNYTFP